MEASSLKWPTNGRQLASSMWAIQFQPTGHLDSGGNWADWSGLEQTILCWLFGIKFGRFIELQNLMGCGVDKGQRWF